MSFLAPLFFVGLAAIAVPIWVHLIQRERKDIIEFPSVMFLQRIPYESVERRRIHNWWLLLLRMAAMVLIIAAFSRPFFSAGGVAAAVVAASGAREVVILLDRSASMGYDDRWSRAQDEARQIVNGLGGDDRATLLLFDRGVEEAVRATSNAGELELAIGQASVSSEATRFAPVLREAQSRLSRSDLGRKEAFLISDFQRTGWERQEDIGLPEGAVITPVSVTDGGTSNLAISSLDIRRESFSNQERATLTVGVVNRGGSAVTGQPVRLEIDGRLMETREVSVGPDTSGTVTFDPITVADANMRGRIQAGSDALPQDNEFYFVLSPSRTVSVLVLQSDDAPPETSLFLTTVLDLSESPPFNVDVVPVSRFAPDMIEGRSVVVVNDTTGLSTTATDALARFVNQGGGLFVILGVNTPVGGEWPLLPGTIGPSIDRTGLSGGTLGTPDSSHPIFENFRDSRTGNFANMRFFRYRRLAAAPADRVLLRFDDGATAVAERRVGAGRVVALTSTIDGDWNDFPRHGMFLPVMHETIRYLAQYEDPVAWQTVGRVLDIAAPVASMVREGLIRQVPGGATGPSGVVVSPSDQQVTLGGAGTPSIEMSEQGFYGVRLPGMGDRRPYSVAVNLDPAESDLSPFQPTEFIAAATGRGAVVAGGESLEEVEVRPEDVEKRQSLWWFLLLAGLSALLLEAVIANRLSKSQNSALAEPG